MSNLSMVMSFKCSICCEVVYDHLRLSFNASNALSLCRIGVKYQHTFGAVCAYARVFRKRPVCALIGACALIRTNTVNQFSLNVRTPIKVKHPSFVLCLIYFRVECIQYIFFFTSDASKDRRVDE